VFQDPKQSPDFQRRFKTLALEHDLKMNGLLFAAIEAFEKQHGGKR